MVPKQVRSSSFTAGISLRPGVGIAGSSLSWCILLTAIPALSWSALPPSLNSPARTHLYVHPFWSISRVQHRRALRSGKALQASRGCMSWDLDPSGFKAFSRPESVISGVGFPPSAALRHWWGTPGPLTPLGSNLGPSDGQLSVAARRATLLRPWVTSYQSPLPKWAET